MDEQPTFDPTGRRRGSLRGSGTQDEFMECSASGVRRDRIDDQLMSPPGAIEDVGAGATVLEAEIRAELDAQNRSRSPTQAPLGGPAP